MKSKIVNINLITMVILILITIPSCVSFDNYVIRTTSMEK